MIRRARRRILHIGFPADFDRTDTRLLTEVRSFTVPVLEHDASSAGRTLALARENTVRARRSETHAKLRAELGGI